MDGWTYPWSPRRIKEDSVGNPIRDAGIEIHGMGDVVANQCIIRPMRWPSGSGLL
jgi:hypothetical protein